eukprot:CAMPEP_0119307646 /NCGR_PEP_ID=MMETSP1333-20130426/8081_1 /TAXON_ID=418940 /ORGANISM="Scyphosphaera apsteinii, Strain RCC1455" /LENGTH=320 /DNA_ID=CAMNT_0007311235 /DNA_START=112 /DNA_END=1074 /DNA_ORIENTATION=-
MKRHHQKNIRHSNYSPIEFHPTVKATPKKDASSVASPCSAGHSTRPSNPQSSSSSKSLTTLPLTRLSPSPSKPWKGKKVTPEDYIAADGVLHPLDALNFCAAGALLWHARSNELQMLLAVESRKPGRGSDSPGEGILRELYNFLGGKRDFVEEHPRLVAARECWEETGGRLSAAARKRMEENAKPVIWHSGSKYALFIHELGAADSDLAERVASSGRPPNPEHDANLRGLVWVPLRLLLNRTWRTSMLHPFASQQAKAALPAVQQLFEEQCSHVSRQPSTHEATSKADDEIAGQSNGLAEQLALVAINSDPVPMMCAGRN